MQYKPRPSYDGFGQLLIIVLIAFVIVVGLGAYWVGLHQSQYRFFQTKLSTSTGDSGIVGSAVLGPTQPVCQTHDTCSTTYKHSYSVDVESASTRNTFTTSQADNNGQFRVSLPAGEYILAASAGKSGPAAKPVTVNVPAHTYITVTLNFDTGIY